MPGALLQRPGAEARRVSDRRHDAFRAYRAGAGGAVLSAAIGADLDLFAFAHDTILPATSRCIEITSALFDLQLELEVVISTLIVSAEEWESGLCQVLPIRREIEREGVAA